MKRILLTLFICGLGVAVQAQMLMFRGVVADSISLANIPDVYVRVKGTQRITATDKQGAFTILAKQTDTLVFSSVGYKTRIQPLLLVEDALLIFLSEEKIMLNPVLIKGWRLYPNKTEDRTKTKVRALKMITSLGGSVGNASGISLFDYFSKNQREIRKLNKIITEQNSSQIYIQVINDPDFKKIMLADHHIDEATYFNLLARFNKEKRFVQYYTDPDKIMEDFHLFIEESLKKQE